MPLDAQSLGDALAGAAGAPVNRPQLNAFVANSQALNGLRSAQTEEAMMKAQEAQEQMTAHAGLEDALTKAMGPNNGAQAHAATLIMLSHFGDAKTALDAVNRMTLGDQGQLGQPSQTAAQQAVQGKVAIPEALPNNYTQLPGAAPVQPGQSVEGQAQTAQGNADAALHAAQAAAGGFNPHAGAGANQPIDPNMVAFGGYMLYKTGKMPAMGMGGGPARAAIIANAAQLSQQEAAGQNIANPGFDQAIANNQDFTAAGRALNNYAGGNLGNQTRSINNVVGHLQLMENLFTGLQNGDVQIANKLGAQWKKQFGSEIPTNIQTASSFIGPELTKILSANGSTGTAEERQDFANTAANLANSPEQTGGAISTLKNMLGRQMTDMALQYHGATGRSDFARRYVAPDVAQYLELNPDSSAPAGSTGVVPPNPSPNASIPAGGAATTLPPQALSALKENVHTTFGNGQVWTLQNGKPVRVQ